MKPREIKNNVYKLGVVDWDRRLFDSLIPLPDGTSYNSYLIKGSEKTVLIDSVDPAFEHVFMSQLEDIANIDFVVANHAEQDHSGTIPTVLEKYPQAKVICTPKCQGMLIDHLHLQKDKIITVNDGETLSLGDKSLEFIHTPWVHWPETMVTYLKEDKMLFSCDFFGSHLATSELYAPDECHIYEPAKRYYAEIMMPFRNIIKRNMEKVMTKEIDFICPSHGPIYDKPQFILRAYLDWISDKPRNIAVIPYVSMHGSTSLMVEHLVSKLVEKGIGVQQFELSSTDIGKLAMSLVDAATLVVGAPTVHVGPHPLAFYAIYLANILRPKVKFVSLVGSYGWNSKFVEQSSGLIPFLKVEMLDPVLCKGMPREADFSALDKLAETIYNKHHQLGLI